MFGGVGVPICEVQIYINKYLKNGKNYTELGGGCRLSTGVCLSPPFGGI